MIEKSLLRSKATGSGAERWMNCPASVAMEFQLTESDKKYAEEGTKAHKIAADAIMNNTPLEEIEDDAVRSYVETTREIAGPGEFIVEQRLPLLGSSGGVDCYAIRDRVAFLSDFKYGVGIKLTAQDNEQLAFYSVAIREKHPEVKTVQAYLIQPRVTWMARDYSPPDDEDVSVFDEVPNITSWTLPYQTLAMWRRRFEEALVEVEKAQTIKAGPWCQFCKAKGGCPTYVVYAETTKLSQEGFPENLIPAPGETWVPEIVPRVAQILLSQKVISNWFGKAEEFLLNLAQSSPANEELVRRAGFQLAEKRSNRKWKSEAGDGIAMTENEIAQALKDRGIQSPYKKSLIKITEAEKIAKVDDLTVKPKGGPKIKPIEKGKGKRLSLPDYTE